MPRLSSVLSSPQKMHLWGRLARAVATRLRRAGQASRSGRSGMAAAAVDHGGAGCAGQRRTGSTRVLSRHERAGDGSGCIRGEDGLSVLLPPWFVFLLLPPTAISSILSPQCLCLLFPLQFFRSKKSNSFPTNLDRSIHRFLSRMIGFLCVMEQVGSKQGATIRSVWKRRRWEQQPRPWFGLGSDDKHD